MIKCAEGLKKAVAYARERLGVMAGGWLLLSIKASLLAAVALLLAFYYEDCLSLMDPYYSSFIGLAEEWIIDVTEGTRRYISGFTSSLNEGFSEVTLALSTVDWLYWLLLYIPFTAVYIYVRELIFGLRTELDFMKGENALKNKMLNWQNAVNMGLHQKIAEMRVGDIKVQENLQDRLTTDGCCKHRPGPWGDGYRPSCRRDFIVVAQRNRNPAGTLKRNKSDSSLSNKKANERMGSGFGGQMNKMRPKSGEANSLSGESSSHLLDGYPKKTVYPPWLEAKRRSIQGSREPLHLICQKNQKSSKEKLSVGTDKSDSEMKTPGRGGGKGSMSGSASSSRTSIGQASLSKLQRRCLSGNSKEKETQNYLSPPHLPSPEKLDCGDVRELIEDVKEMGKPTSYTEVIKKRVQVPSNGSTSGTRITIEGQRRWCF